MYTVLLSGGSGKRLWPLSNNLRSKQYLKVVKGITGESQSMLQRVWSQIKEEGLDKGTIITAGKSQVEIIKSQLGLDAQIAVEPSRRDTFPAIALSCAYLKSIMNADESEAVAIIPVDPFTEQLYFKTVRSLERILSQSQVEIALMGAIPTYPSAKYGYIVPSIIKTTMANGNSNDNSSENYFDGNNNNTNTNTTNTNINTATINTTDTTNLQSYYLVDGFCEKPSEDEALRLIERGALWNCGVFCFTIGYVLDYIRKLGLPTDYSSLYEAYDKLPKISFDYEMVEKCRNICAVRFEGQWKDLGTWNTLTEEMDKSSMGNCVLSESCMNTNVINELEIPIVVIGGTNLIVAASADGILVSDKAQSSYMKEYIKDIGEFPMFEERRWGSLKVIDISRKENVLTMTRRVKLKGGMNSSLHFHENRDEIWTILSGEGKLLRNGDVICLKPGDSVRIPKLAKHAILADSDLDIIEIQIGSSIGSEDITRLIYDWDEIWNQHFGRGGKIL